MKILKPTSQFKKDLKRINNKTHKHFHLKTVLNHLENTGTVPIKYNPHLLVGKYKGYMECHVENDFLLIWLDEEENTVEVVRVGTHSELF